MDAHHGGDLVGRQSVERGGPNWVWGKPRALPDGASRERLIRRRKIGTPVYFIAGSILLVTSFR